MHDKAYQNLKNMHVLYATLTNIQVLFVRLLNKMACTLGGNTECSFLTAARALSGDEARTAERHRRLWRHLTAFESAGNWLAPGERSLEETTPVCRPGAAASAAAQCKREAGCLCSVPSTFTWPDPV